MYKKFLRFSGFLAICLLILMIPLTANAAKSRTRIHFISLEGNNDAILLESNGRFAMVDSGEDSDYPKGNNTKYPLRPGINTTGGREKEVIRYLKKAGVKKLDFYIGTHAHSDHIGSGDEILRTFKTERLYLNKYSDSYISNKDLLYDNLYCYDTLISMAKKRGTKIIQDFTKPSNRSFTLGDMNIEIMNYKRATDSKGRILPRPDDNYNSLGVKITANSYTAFLGGDINNFVPDRDEDKLAPQIGAVDLLKLGHHGIAGSNSTSFLKNLYPEIAIATGPIMNMSGATKDLLNRMDTALYTTNGQPLNSAVIADMTTPGESIQMISPGNYTLKSKKGNKKQSAFYTPNNRMYSRKNTWFYYNRNYYYITSNGSIMRSSWKQEGEYWYYLDSSGIMLTQSAKIRNIPYSFDSSGRLSEGGWTRGNNSWSYAMSDGRALTGWQKLSNEWFYFDKSGIMKTGWMKSGGKQYYLKNNGAMVTKSFINFGGQMYYLRSDGVMLRNTRMKIKGKTYTFNDAGICTNYK